MCLAFTAGSALLIHQGNQREHSSAGRISAGNCHECSTTINKNTDLCTDPQLLKTQFTSKLEGQCLLVVMWKTKLTSAAFLFGSKIQDNSYSCRNSSFAFRCLFKATASLEVSKPGWTGLGRPWDSGRCPLYSRQSWEQSAHTAETPLATPCWVTLGSSYHSPRFPIC